MASSYSSTLRLELIGDGDQSGIWGQTTNNNLGFLLEQAITGVVTITMTDANYVLTSFNGVVDEARNALIIATGTNSQQRNIVAPLVEKIYTIKNSTTGGFAVQIIGATGTGVVIPNGSTASVFCDGFNFYPLSTGSSGNFTVNGNLSVTGTTSLTGALNGSTATFSGAISSVSPSFTGTPTAPTAVSGTNTTQIATTAFVTTAVAGGLGTLGTMALQNANAVAITGGSLSGMTNVAGGTHSGTTASYSGNITSLGIVSGASGVFGPVSGTTGTFSSTVTGASFSGAGTGLTGTAASLTVGNASLVQGFTPVQQGGGAGQGTNKIYIGWGSSALRVQVDATDQGIFLLSTNYNNYAPTLTGTGASGTWAINISGVTTNTSSNGFGNRTVSASSPTGGSDGDIWYQV